MITPASKSTLSLPILLIILAVILIVGLGGVLFYNSQKKRIIIEKQNELAAIATLKADNIKKWRMEHIRDGAILSNIIPRNQLIQNFLISEDPSDLGVELLERMKIFIWDYDYHSILLVDTTGSIRLVYPSDINPKLNSSRLTELKNPEITLSSLYLSDEMPGNIRIDVQIPLFAGNKNNRTRFGTILLRIDPFKDFFPLIQSWPTPSRSSETLLVRREGDSVLFLNELRHIKNTALKFKMPLTETLPSTKAIQGYEGTFEGIDYLGDPVLSYLSRIPDSPWFMVAKVDKKEIYSPLNRLIFAVLIIVFLLILMASFLILYLYRNQRIRYLTELNSTKDKFFSIVSHDLRSPFTSIKGFADILLQKENLSNNEVKKYAEIINTASQNAIVLLKNLTEWSRLQTNRVIFNPKEIDLISIIDQEIEIANCNAVQKSVNLNKEVPEELKIQADVDMISLAIRNLLSNAIKFSYHGGNINISVTKKTEAIFVSVCDFGTGIKKEIIEKLFKIEENVSTPGTQKEAGSGLGLILVKEFISLHGGQIYIESEVGKCSKFTFSIPNNHH